jgi:hypothetical protein
MRGRRKMQDIVQTEKRASGALRLFMVGMLTIVAALVANLVVRSLAFAIWPISPDFLPLQVGSICFFTVVLVGGDVLVYALVVRFSRHPVRTYTMIALIALLLSLVPPVMLFFNPDTRMLPGVTPLAASILMVIHIVDALIAIVLLTRLAPSKWGAHPFLNTKLIRRTFHDNTGSKH